jgi:hypothetical protein
MANTYRAISERGKGLHGEDVFEAEFSAADEADQIAGGHLEIAPRAYKVLSDNYSAGKQGEVVDLALLVDLEAALIQGGHIERAEKPATTTTKKKG